MRRLAVLRLTVLHLAVLRLAVVFRFTVLRAVDLRLTVLRAAGLRRTVEHFLVAPDLDASFLRRLVFVVAMFNFFDISICWRINYSLERTGV